MELNVKELKCGECGSIIHRLYKRENGEILVECFECNSVSEITINRPALKISNVSGFGTLCVYD